MSIIPRRSVTVIPMTVARDRYNSWEKTRGVPVVVDDVTVQADTDRTRDPGENDLLDAKTIRGKGVWPGGVHSIVVIDGEEYDQVGKVKVRSIGTFTKHFQVRVAARGAEVK